MASTWLCNVTSSGKHMTMLQHCHGCVQPRNFGIPETEQLLPVLAGAIDNISTCGQLAVLTLHSFAPGLRAPQTLHVCPEVIDIRL